MKIAIDLTDNEADILLSVIKGMDYEAYGIEEDEMEDLDNAFNKINEAISITHALNDDAWGNR